MTVRGDRILEVHKALDILRDECPLVQTYLQPAQTLGYGRTMNTTKLTALVQDYPMDMHYHDAGVSILGVPIDDTTTRLSISMTNLLELIVF
jgi:hypothetical protein